MVEEEEEEEAEEAKAEAEEEYEEERFSSLQMGGASQPQSDGEYSLATLRLFG